MQLFSVEKLITLLHLRTHSISRIRRSSPPSAIRFTPSSSSSLLPRECCLLAVQKEENLDDDDDEGKTHFPAAYRD
jgi:hypothetical protein